MSEDATLVLLQHHPHHEDVVAGVAPVPRCIEVTEDQRVELAERDLGHRPGDLARHKVCAAA